MYSIVGNFENIFFIVIILRTGIHAAVMTDVTYVCINYVEVYSWPDEALHNAHHNGFHQNLRERTFVRYVKHKLGILAEIP